jgi:farnesol dehydrogenase
MVFVSTAGVWGPSGNTKITEETISKVEPQTDYEKSKREAELEIKRGKFNGLKIVIVNPTRVFGPGLLNKSNVATYFEKYINGKFHFMPGNGKQLANYVYISDLIKGIKLAIEHGEHKENYLLGGENVTFNNIFTSVGKIAGRKYKLFGIPPLLIWLISYLELLKANTLGIKPLITPGFAKKYSNNWMISSEKAERELGYCFMPLADSLLETVNWLRINN